MKGRAPSGARPRGQREIDDLLSLAIVFVVEALFLRDDETIKSRAARADDRPEPENG
jgi:hypothetical protein